jgi:hypothetical protein
MAQAKGNTRTRTETAEELDVDEIVRDTLRDVTPRAAALALMRFSDYLDLIRSAGVNPTDELCAALFEELRAICARDRWTEPVADPIAVDEA